MCFEPYHCGNDLTLFVLEFSLENHNWMLHCNTFICILQLRYHASWLSFTWPMTSFRTARRKGQNSPRTLHQSSLMHSNMCTGQTFFKIKLENRNLKWDLQHLNCLMRLALKLCSVFTLKWALPRIQLHLLLWHRSSKRICLLCVFFFVQRWWGGL